MLHHSAHPRAIGFSPSFSIHQIRTDGNQSENSELSPILSLFQDRHTTQLHSRQIGAVHRVCSDRKNGIRVTELVDLTLLMQECRTKVEEGKKEFEEALCKLVALLKKPLVIENSFQTTEKKYAAVKLLKLLGELFAIQNVQLTQTICEAMCVFLDKKNNLAQNTIKSAHAIEIAIESDFPDLLIKKVAEYLKSYYAPDPISVVKNDEGEESKSLKKSLIESVLYSFACVLRELSSFPICCHVLIEKKISTLVDDLIRIPQLINPCVDLLGNLLEFTPLSSPELCSYNCLSSIRAILLDLIQSGYTKKEKEIRNDLLAILLVFSREKINRILFLRTNILEYLLLISCCVELDRVDGEFVKPFLITAASEDLEMKILMWEIIRELSSEFRCLSRIMQFQIMNALLAHFNLNWKPNEIINWSTSQKAVVRKHALLLLNALVSLIPRQFADLQGHILIATFAYSLDVNMMTSLVEVEQLMRLLYLACMSVESISNSSELFKICLSISLDERQNLSARAYSLQVLTNICHVDTDQKRNFRKSERVNDLVSCFHSVKGLLLDPFFMVCLVHFIWCAVAGDPKNEACFRLADGLEALFELLHAGPNYLRKPLLGLITDLLQNKNNMDAGIEWRSAKSASNLMQVVLSIWEEEASLRSLPDSSGTDSLVTSSSKKLLDAWKMGINSYTPSETAGRLDTSMRIFQLEVSKKTFGSDCRFAIVALCQLFGFDDNIFPDLTNKQKACLQHISNYVAIKTGQEWSEIARQMNEEDIRPVTPDLVCLEQNLALSELNATIINNDDNDLQVDESDKDFSKSFFETVHAKEHKKEILKSHGMKKKTMTKDQRDEMLQNALDADLTLTSILGSNQKEMSISQTEETTANFVEKLDEDEVYLKNVLNDKTLRSMNEVLRRIVAKTK